MYNTESECVSPVMKGLVNTGADLLKNLWDVQIKCDLLDEQFWTDYPLAARASGFSIPEIGVDTYDNEYQGQKVPRTNGKSTLAKEFSITFREDAALNLRKFFTLWHSMTNDVGSGGMGNTVGKYGTISVGVLTGAFTAATWNTYHNGPGGTLDNGSTTNPLAAWTFFNAWPSKVGGIELDQGGGPNTFTVQFKYEYLNEPFTNIDEDGNFMTIEDSASNAAGAWDAAE